MKRYLVWAFLMLIVMLGFSSINLAEEGKWTKKADMPTTRYALAASTANGKIYAIGGFGIGGPRLDVHVTLPTVEEYDPVTDKWKKKADMPTARAWLATSVVNEKIYAFGGLIDRLGPRKPPPPPLLTVEEYDPATNTWTKKTDMPTARWSLATSAVNGKIYAIGGAPGASVVEEYDPVTDTWTKKADMPTPRAYLSTSAVNGKIYAIGGRKGAFLPTVEEYDPGLGIKSKGKLPTSWGKIKSKY